GEPVDWDQVYDGYSATTDWPGAGFSKELADHFPDAKIILTARNVDSWWESYSSTIMEYLVELPEEGLPPHIDAMARSVIDMLSNKLFKSGIDDEQAAKAAYQDHVNHMTTAYADGRVLSFDVKDGWATLCEFLGKPVPDGEFPRANNSEEFWVNFGPDREA
ncbi:MAG: sulfotransferase family protein, partial [Rhodospirillaceae bacterium]|nr:sulfotransferase family protein [Rhodospirillaceae bacterium]